MPELPEVETVRRGLEPVMTGARMTRVEQRRTDLRFPFPDGFVSRLTGKQVLRLGRRAKYLTAELDSGEVLIMHLGMSGRFSVLPPKSEQPDLPPDVRGDMLGEFVHETGTLPAHDHAVFHMSNGAVITYNDVRRFGFMDLVAAEDLATCRHFRDLGVEPLGNTLSAPVLARCAAGRTSDLKAFLMDQRNVAGLGNIYVCEALHLAGLSPRRKSGVLTRRNGTPTERAERLTHAIRNVIAAAIEAGGSTLRDYAHTDGSLGYFQHRFQVYGRENEACLKAGCGGTVSRMVQAGRSTFWCRHCQR